MTLRATLLLGILALVLLAGCGGQVETFIPTATDTPTPSDTPTATPDLDATASQEAFQVSQTALWDGVTATAQAEATQRAGATMTEAARPTETPTPSVTPTFTATPTATDTPTATPDFGATATVVAQGLFTTVEAAQTAAQAVVENAQAAQDAAQRTVEAALSDAYAIRSTAEAAQTAAAAAIMTAQAEVEAAQATAEAAMTQPATVIVVITPTPYPTFTPSPIIVTATPFGPALTATALIQTATAIAATGFPPTAVFITPTPSAPPFASPTFTPSASVIPSPTTLVWWDVTLPAQGIRLEVPAHFSQPETLDAQTVAMRPRGGYPASDGLTIARVGMDDLLSGVYSRPPDDDLQDPVEVLRAAVTVPVDAPTDVIVLDEVMAYEGLEYPAARVRLRVAGFANELEVVFIRLGDDDWLSVVFSASEDDLALWLDRTLASIELLSEMTATPTVLPMLTPTPTPMPFTPTRTPTPAPIGSPTPIAWQTVDLPDLGLRLDYPAGWPPPEDFGSLGADLGQAAVVLAPESIFSADFSGPAIMVASGPQDSILETMQVPPTDPDDPVAILETLVEVELANEGTLVTEGVQTYEGRGFLAGYVVLAGIEGLSGADEVGGIGLARFNDQQWVLLAVLGPQADEVTALLEGTLASMILLERPAPTVTPAPAATATAIPTEAMEATAEPDLGDLTFAVPEGWMVDDRVRHFTSEVPLVSLIPEGAPDTGEQNIVLMRGSGASLARRALPDDASYAQTVLESLVVAFIDSSFSGGRIYEVQIGGFPGVWTQYRSETLTIRFYLLQAGEDDWLFIYARNFREGFNTFSQTALREFLNSLELAGGLT